MYIIIFIFSYSIHFQSFIQIKKFKFAIFFYEYIFEDFKDDYDKVIVFCVSTGFGLDPCIPWYRTYDLRMNGSRDGGVCVARCNRVVVVGMWENVSETYVEIIGFIGVANHCEYTSARFYVPSVSRYID